MGSNLLTAPLRKRNHPDIADSNSSATRGALIRPLAPWRSGLSGQGNYRLKRQSVFRFQYQNRYGIRREFASKVRGYPIDLGRAGNNLLRVFKRVGVIKAGGR